MDDLQSILAFVALSFGIVLTLLEIAELFVKLKLPQFLRRVLSNPTVGWISAGLALIALAAIALPGLRGSEYRPGDLAVEGFGFENNDDGWSSVDLRKDETPKAIFLSDNGRFPGIIQAGLSSEYRLDGQSSLRLDVDVKEPGAYMGFIYRKGSVVAQGITIFVMTPEIPDSSYIGQVQLCVPSHGWACSGARELVPGEWVPLVLDLAGPADGPKVAGQVLKELAIQWNFDTETEASYELYLDAGQVWSAK